MKILIVVDMQKDFIDGALGTKEAQAIVPNVKKKIEDAVANGDFIVFTRDTHRDNYLETREGKKLPVKHCVCGTDGWQIPEELLPVNPDPNDEYFTYWVENKRTFGLWNLASNLEMYFKTDFLNNVITEIELVGLCTDICVVSNALLLKTYFYDKCEITVDASCCAGVTPETHKAALQTMKMCQINVIGE